MDSVLDTFNKYARFDLKEDDDLVDRLNHRYTAITLLVCAGLVSVYQSSYTPVTCWNPAHFHGSWNKYTKSYCWVHNMHYVPFDDYLPRNRAEADELEEMKYYQWVPFILLFQALFFVVPSIFWHGLNQKAGIDADHILLAANRLELSTAAKENDVDIVEKKRKQYTWMIVRQISAFLGRSHRKTHKNEESDKKTKSKFRLNSYLVSVFMFSKILYLANIVFQFFIVSKILGLNYLRYGIEIMSGMWTEHDWETSHDVTFPRVAFCDMDVRRLGNVHRYSTQCTLLLNMFNEKIYIGLWFWFILLGVANLMGFVTWILRIAMHGDRLLFLQNHLRAGHKTDTDRKEKLVNRFMDNYLGQDGVFILRLISANTTAIVTTEVTGAVWDHWYKEEKLDEENNEKQPFAENVV